MQLLPIALSINKTPNTTENIHGTPGKHAPKTVNNIPPARVE